MKSRIAVGALLAVLSPAAWAQEGAAIYKAKCAVCHGSAGQGKAKVGPKLVGTTKSEEEIASLITKGGAAKAPHVKPMSGLQGDAAKSAAGFVKRLK